MTALLSPTIYQAMIETDSGAAERIVAALDEWSEQAPLAVGQFEAGPGRTEVFAHFTDAPDEAALHALILRAANGSDIGSLHITPLPDADWVTLSQGMRAPVQAGRFIVHGSHDRANVRRGRYAIEIDAGQAFGTAHHATTLGCLLAFDGILKARRPKRIVDVGTGTGVLAIAAAKALQRRVAVSDNDPVAVATALENARVNGVAAKLRAVVAEGLRHPTLRGKKHDLIFANILARPLHRLAPGLGQALAANELLILSGITADQAPSIAARYRSLGFILERRILLEGWATLIFRRRSSRKARQARLIAATQHRTKDHVSKLR